MLCEPLQNSGVLIALSLFDLNGDSSPKSQSWSQDLENSCQCSVNDRIEWHWYVPKEMCFYVYKVICAKVNAVVSPGFRTQLPKLSSIYAIHYTSILILYQVSNLYLAFYFLVYSEFFLKKRNQFIYLRYYCTFYYYY